jgi:hypothetical protein
MFVLCPPAFRPATGFTFGAFRRWGAVGFCERWVCAYLTPYWFKQFDGLRLKKALLLKVRQRGLGNFSEAFQVQETSARSTKVRNWAKPSSTLRE